MHHTLSIKKRENKNVLILLYIKTLEETKNNIYI